MWKKPGKTKEPENLNKAYEYAVFLLSLQLRTVGEIREKMLGRGYTSSVIENVLEQLHDQKYLDDERYAAVFLDNLKQYKNLGYFGIKRKFMAKKLPADLIEKTLAEGLSLEDELKIAKRYMKKLSSPGVILSPNASAFRLCSRHPERSRMGEDEESLKFDEGENIYNTFSEESSKQKQKVIQKLKSRGFRGDVIAKLAF